MSEPQKFPAGWNWSRVRDVLTHLEGQSEDEQAVEIEVAVGSPLTAVLTAPRALVFLTVPWSTPERNARVQFRAAADRLAAEHPELGVAFFSLDEEADWCQVWLCPLGIPGLDGGVPRGSGSMLWLEKGRLVSSELGGAGLAAGGIIARTLWLWATPSV